MSELPNLFDMGVDIDINDGVTRPGSPLPSLPLPLLRTAVYVILILKARRGSG